MDGIFRRVVVGFCLLLSGYCIAQGQDDPKPRIYTLHIRSDILYRFATTLVTSRVANPLNQSTEAVFDVILPNEAFISNFTLEIDGVVYPGDVQEKEKAKKAYQKAKKQGHSAGHVSQRPRDTNTFKVEVNVAALSKVTFNLTYQELLRRKKGAYQHTIYVNPGQPVEDLQIDVAIQESREITMLNVPPIRRNDIEVEGEDNAVNAIAVVSQPTAKSAYIKYIPTIDNQLSISDVGIAGQFIVEYEIERDLDAGDLLVVNGYFVHFLAPKVTRPIPKDVLFILDVSGSMEGQKIQQMKDAMLRIMDDLGEGDRFNIIRFNSQNYPYKDEMIKVSQQSIAEAKVYISDLEAGGSTNINSALLEGLRILRATKIAGERSPIVVFLTDGQGESKTILANVKSENEGGIPVFSLAFGSDADWDLVKMVAVQNNGIGRKIYEDSDAALQITGFYDELAVTLLNKVNVKYIGDSISEDSVTKSTFNSYFNGSEMVVAGKLNDPEGATINLEIFSNSVEGDLVLSVDSANNIIDFSDVVGLTKITDISEITERTWAYLTIKQLLENVAAETNATAAAEMKQQALDMSLKYHFVTGLTSMVVTKPDDDDSDVEDDASSAQITVAPTRAPSRQYSRGGGGGGRGYSGGGGGDPHFLIRIAGVEQPICFDVHSIGGETYTLLRDPRHGITINAAIIKSGISDKLGNPKTFIGQVSVITKHHHLIVTPDAIFFDTKLRSWKKEYIQHFGGNKFEVKDSGHVLSVRFHFGPEVLIRRHIAPAGETLAVSWLNVYINHEDRFSKATNGLLGQFVNGHKHITLKKTWTSDGRKPMAKFQVKVGPGAAAGAVPVRHTIRANLAKRSEVVDKGEEECWVVHQAFGNALYGGHSDYLTSDLFQA